MDVGKQHSLLYDHMLKQNHRPHILGIIPARGGSKRLIGKNIRPLLGRPLIDYVIQAGLNNPRLDGLIVTTDDENIRSVALQCKARVPFLRPDELAQDTSSTEETLRDAVLKMEKIDGYQVDVIVLLQATSPFTTAGMIQACIDLYMKGGCRTVITVCEAPARCEWVGIIAGSGRFTQIIDNNLYAKLLPMNEYIPSGNVYVFGREVLFNQQKIIGEETSAVVVPRESAVDIDNLTDFRFAEFLLEKKLIQLDYPLDK